MRELLTPNAVDRFISSAVRRPAIRMVRSGSSLPASDYTQTLRIGGRWIDDAIDPEKVERQLAGGATLVLQSLHRQIPAIADFCSALEHQIDHVVQANAYLTPPHAAGLAPHSDQHAVFVVQLTGHKRWTVDGLDECELSPGDVLYLPAGIRHSAATTRDMSLHLTIGVIATTYRHVLERALRASEPDLDAPIPIGFAHDRRSDFADGVRRRLESLIATVDSIDVDEVVEREAHRRTPRSAGFDGVERMAATDAVSPTTLLAWRHDPSIEQGPDDRIVLRANGRTLDFPASAGPALRAISPSIVVEELPGLDPPSRLVVARRLVREGFCDLVDETG